MSRSFFPMFSSRNFMFSGLLFKSLIHFQLIFVNGIRQGYNFVLLVVIQISQHLLKRPSFSHEYSWTLCQILVDHPWEGLFLSSKFCCICLHVSTLLFYYSFVQSKIRKCDASSFTLFFSRLLWLFGISCSSI